MGDPPISVRQTIGNATTQSGDPAFFGFFPPRTVWFAFRPATSQPVRVSAALRLHMRAGVFTGPDILSLMLIGNLKSPLGIDVLGGRTYWIGVSCSVYYECDLPFRLQLTTIPQAGGAKLPSLP